MHTITVFGLQADPNEGRDYTFPGKWEECTIAQLGTIAALTSVGLHPDADEDTKQRAEAHLRLSLLRELSAMAPAVFERIAVDGLIGLKYDDLGVESAALLPGLDWCLAEPNFQESIVTQVVCLVRRKHVAYSGPTDRLSRFTIKRWGFADALLNKLHQTGDINDLHNLLAVLYHPEGSTWNNADIEEHAAVLAQLDDRTKLAAVLNYRGLRNWLASAYAACFKGGKADPHGMQGMVVRMAGPKFGTVDQAYDANLHDVLVYVDQSIRDAASNASNAPKA